MGKVGEVAKAIREASPAAGRGDSHLRTLALTESVSLDLARAAIEAMKAPTNGMNRAAFNACERSNRFMEMNDGWGEYNRRVFDAMIDAALSEDKEQG